MADRYALPEGLDKHVSKANMDKINTCISDEGPKQIASLLDLSQIAASGKMADECFKIRAALALNNDAEHTAKEQEFLKKVAAQDKVGAQAAADDAGKIEERIGLREYNDFVAKVSQFDQKGVGCDLTITTNGDAKFEGKCTEAEKK